MQDYLIKINEFCDRLILTGRKEVTVTVYRSMLSICFEMLDKAGMHTDVMEVGEEEIYFLKKNLHRAERTVKQYIRVMNLYLKYHGRCLVENMHILWNRDVDHRLFIGWQDFATLYKAADPPQRMVLVLGAMMGLRRIEISSIRLSDIHRTSITVHGKGHGDEGLVVDQPMPQEVREEIARYLKWRSAVALPDCDRLVVWDSYRRVGMSLKAKQEEVLRERMNQLRIKTGVEFTPHSLRRLYACSLYKNDVDLLTIRDLMRHADISTTQRYLTRDSERITSAVENLGKTLGGVLNI